MGDGGDEPVSADEEPVDRASWLLEPPGAGEVRLVVELGEGAELTPEVQASLETLMSQLNDAEVAGYAFNAGGFASFGLFGGLSLPGSCEKLVCGKHDCDRHTCGSYKSLA